MKSRLALLAALVGVIPFVGAGPWCRRTAADAVRTCCGDARRDDTGRLLEHRGPVRDRPSRPRRSLRARELRQQVPGRGGRVHGHRPRSHLRRRGGDRGWLQALCDHGHRDPERHAAGEDGWNAWAAWRRAEGEWKPYGKANANVRPHLPRAIPHAWWTRLGKLPAPASSSPAAASSAIATAAYETLVGLQPTLGLDERAGDPQRRLHGIDGRSRRRCEERGVAVGERVAQAVLAQARKRRPGAQPDLADLSPPPRRDPASGNRPLGAGARPSPARRRPLALRSASQFRPEAPIRSRARSTPTTSTRSRSWAGQQRVQDARADDPGALLDRPRPQAVERRHAPSRRRPGAGHRTDGADAGDGARRRAATR